jgi:hypothetical protein
MENNEVGITCSSSFYISNTKFNHRPLINFENESWREKVMIWFYTWIFLSIWKKNALVKRPREGNVIVEWLALVLYIYDATT